MAGAKCLSAAIVLLWWGELFSFLSEFGQNSHVCNLVIALLQIRLFLNMEKPNLSVLWGRAWIGGVSTLCLPTRILVSNDLIQLQAFGGIYYFYRDSVVSVTRKSRKKILITHVVKEYPTTIVFSGEGAYKAVNDVGFLPCASPSSEKHIHSLGIPIKVWTCGLAITLWFLPVFIGAYIPYLTMACFLVLGIFCTLLLTSETVQNITLKPDRKIGEIYAKVSLSAVILLIVLFPMVMFLTYACEKSNLFCPEECYEKGYYDKNSCPHYEDFPQDLIERTFDF
ncbi:MAG: hypothetical protein AAFQ63_02250 [Cyanobacteria bacterium J06621_11]